MNSGQKSPRSTLYHICLNLLTVAAIVKSHLIEANCESLKTELLYFCRAILCKRGLCCHAVCVYVCVCVGVCVCVCVPVTFVHSVKTNKHIFKIFSPPVATPF